MDDIFKYQRIEGALTDIFTKERVSAAKLETDHIILGTESGYLHIINFSGQVVKSARLHKRAINCISVDLDGELTVLCGADNGAAIVLSLSTEDFRDSTYKINEPIKAVCLEPSGNDAGGIEQNTFSRKGEKAFLVGTSAGRLILQKPSGWFRQSQKEVVLFPGAGSAVTSITWERNFVAWSDASQVRVMDISTQTALCQMSAPVGVGPEEPYPCSLCWLGPRDLLIGWADNFRHVRLASSAANAAGGSAPAVEEGARVASVVAEWSTDCLICGLQGLDEEHVAYLGYMPPLEEEDLSMGAAEVGEGEEDEEELARRGGHPSNQPELIVAKRKTGELVSADALPLRGFNMDGPDGYILLSSYMCKRNRGDVNKWQLRSYQSQRGGARGFAPLFFVLAPQDMVVARVRDVNDRVGHALAQRDLKRAVDIARVDRASLSLYQYADLLQLYLTHLLEQREATTAASECRRLLGDDAALWETWVYRFIDFKQLESIAGIIPTERPALSGAVYEAVLANLLAESPKAFLDTVKRWGRCVPKLFDHQALLRTLETLKAGDKAQGGGSYYLEAQAQLYIIGHMYEKAVHCYLDPRIAERLAASAPAGAAGSAASYRGDKEEGRVEYRFVFDLIERQGLFKAVSNKIINLVRLSKPLAGKLLLAHLDKLPIRAVAQQLSSDRRLFLWYLHLLFTDPAAREAYGEQLEYGDLHARQVQLYAELMPRPPTAAPSSSSGSFSGANSSSSRNRSQSLVQQQKQQQQLQADASAAPEQVRLKRTSLPDSDLLVFLKSGLAPLDLALVECEKQSPPLFAEMVYIHAQMGNQRKALQLLMAEIGDVALAIDFVESQLDSRGGGGKRRSGYKARADRPEGPVSAAASHFVESQLWDDLVEFCLSHPAYLTKVLDHLGLCKLNPVSVISKIPSRAHVPHLRLRLLRVLEQLKFQTELSLRSTALQEVDALSLLRQQNQGQRRAMKVDTSVRCSACSRPLAMAPGSAIAKGGQLHMQLLELTHSASGAVQVWGPKPAGVGVGAGAGMGGAGSPTQVSAGPGVAGEFNIFSDAEPFSPVATAAAPAALHRPANTADDDSPAPLAQLEDALGTGSVIFSNKLAFHRLCYMRMHC